MLSEIELKELPEQLIFSWRGKVRVSEIARKMGEVYGRIFPYLIGQHVDFAGPPLSIYYEMPQGDEPMEVEFGVPVARKVNRTEDLAMQHVEGGTVATTVYQGPYDEIGPAYDEVMEWVARHDYEARGPMREAYLNGPDDVKDPSQFLTEIVVPVRKKAA